MKQYKPKHNLLNPVARKNHSNILVWCVLLGYIPFLHSMHHTKKECERSYQLSHTIKTTHNNMAFVPDQPDTLITTGKDRNRNNVIILSKCTKDHYDLVVVKDFIPIERVACNNNGIFVAYSGTPCKKDRAAQVHIYSKQDNKYSFYKTVTLSTKESKTEPTFPEKYGEYSVKIQKNRKDAVTQLMFHPANSQLIIAAVHHNAYNNSLEYPRLFFVNIEKNSVYECEYSHPIKQIAISPFHPEILFIASPGILQLMNIEHTNLIQYQVIKGDVLDKTYTSIALHPTTDEYATYQPDENQIHMYDTRQNCQPIKKIPLITHHPLNHMTYSHDNTHIITTNQKSTIVVDINTPTFYTRLKKDAFHVKRDSSEKHDSMLVQTHMSPNGKWLATLNSKDMVKVINVFDT